MNFDRRVAKGKGQRPVADILHARLRRVFAGSPIVRLIIPLLLTLCVLVTRSEVRAADRTMCYLPIAATEAVLATGEDAGQNASTPDLAISRSSVLPTEALGINDSSTGGDADWWRYLQVWRGHHDAPAAESIRRWLGLPLSGEMQISARRGRISPKFLPWRAASFAVVQTPHFEILSRAGAEPSQQIARDLERFYWAWTQLYFPLWSGRDQTAVSLSDWQPSATSIADFLDVNATSRLSSQRRHRVVLLPDQRTFELTISNPQIAAGNPSTVAASTGFYSDVQSTSFFFPQSDRSSIAHEICHQLFEEATDRKRRGVSNQSPTATTKEFWLVEGLAGHFESLQLGDSRASVGGWDSNRLQYARYQTLIARAPVPTIAELHGDRRAIQRRADLPRWYSGAILQTHFILDSQLDSGAAPIARARLIATAAEIYNVDVTDFASLRSADPQPLVSDQRIDRFLMLDDDKVTTHPITGDATSICLAGCEITDTAWASLPPLPRVTWFDASRTPITDHTVQQLISGAVGLEQLSLEATKITPAIDALIGNAAQLRELDLSWTSIDDSVVESLAKCTSLETIWLTGTPITDAAIASLISLPKLLTIDVQRTRVTEAGLKRLQDAKPDLKLNPLQF